MFYVYTSIVYMVYFHKEQQITNATDNFISSNLSNKLSVVVDPLIG